MRGGLGEGADMGGGDGGIWVRGRMRGGMWEGYGRGGGVGGSGWDMGEGTPEQVSSRNRRPQASPPGLRIGWPRGEAAEVHSDGRAT